MGTDIYQQRYIEHQERKKKSFISDWGSQKFREYTNKDWEGLRDVFRNRRSQRVFNGEEIRDSDLEKVVNSLSLVPSSCDRKAVNVSIVRERDDKALLGGLLVGGVGWMHRSDKVLLLFADKLAYKNPAEIPYMPYLDAGVVVEHLYLVCEVLNIGCCFVNPNIREQNVQFFNDKFNRKEMIFCGAMVLGKYNKKAIK
jgi:nitroreductase